MKKAMMVVGCLLGAVVQAADYTWTGVVDSYFGTDGNWSLSGAPGVNDKAILSIDSVVQLGTDVQTATADFRTGGKTVTLDLGGKNWTVTNQFIVSGDAGYLEIRNGTLQGLKPATGTGQAVSLASGNRSTVVITNATVVGMPGQNLSFGQGSSGNKLFIQTGGRLVGISNTLFTADGLANSNNLICVAGPDAALDIDGARFCTKGYNNSLVLTNGARMNILNGFNINEQAASRTNELIVAGGSYLFATNRSNSGGQTLVVGRDGMYGRFQLTGCSTAVLHSTASLTLSIGNNNGSSRNVGIIDGGSLLKTLGGVGLGSNGMTNFLYVSGGARLDLTRGLVIGENIGGTNNQAFFSDGAQLSVGEAIYVGSSGAENKLFAEDTTISGRNAFLVGINSSGNFAALRNSTLDIVGSLYLGQNAIAVSNNMTVSGGRISVGNGSGFYVGYSSMGYNGFYGNAFEMSTPVLVSGWASSRNCFSVTGSTVTVGTSTVGNMIVGNGSGANNNGVEISGGSLVMTNGHIRIGGNTGATNNWLVLRDGALLVGTNNCQLHVGYKGSGLWNYPDGPSNNLFVVENSSVDLVGDDMLPRYGTLQVGYSGTLRLEGSNNSVRVRDFYLGRDGTWETVIGRNGAKPIEVVLGSTQFLTNTVSDATLAGHLRVVADEFQRETGGWVVLLTNKTQNIVGKIDESQMELPKGAVLVQQPRYVAVYIPSTKGTIIRLQ